MKRKNLIARKKVKNNKLLFKDIKIRNFYIKFKSIIFKDIKNESFALAVQEVLIVCAWLILVKCIHMSLVIKFMYQ